MKRRSLLILSVIALLFASCGNKGGNSGLMVPKDAAVVVHINSHSLSSKLSWEEIRQTNWFKSIDKEASASDTLAQQLMANPAASGINTSADMVFYMKKHSRGGYLIFTGALSDAAAFEKFCKLTHENAEVKKDGDFSYMDAKGHSALVWNKSQFAFAANAPMPNAMGIGSLMKGRRHRSLDNEGDVSGNGFMADSLRIFGMGALTLKGSDNLDKDERFTAMLKDSSDVHVWLSMGEYYSGMGGLDQMMPMLKTDALFKDNITAMSINFDNGKISAKSKHYYGDEMSKIMANNKAEPVSADVLNRIPSSNVVAVMAFNYSPKAIKDVLKMVGLDAMADMFLAKVDFSIDDFVKANKGEMVIAVTDLEMKKNEPVAAKGKGAEPVVGMMPFPKTDAKFLFATAVNNKAAFDKMVTMVWDLSKQLRKNFGGSEKTDSSDKPGIHYKLENNWFAVSNSAEYTDKFLAGGNNKLPFVDKISGHPAGMYLDLQKLISFAGSMAKEDSSAASAVNTSLNMWQDIVASGGEYKDKATAFEFEINLVDKTTNSLKQLNQYIDKMANMRKDKMEKIKEITIKDIKSEKMPPPPPPKKKKSK